jgi:L-alanine-DL-glutamate epimerase-like enolase superfamily enzyme
MRQVIDLESVIGGLAACPMRLDVRIDRLALAEPFRISDHLFEDVETVVVRLEADGCVGLGEAAGVFYLGDEPAGMLRAVEQVRDQVEAGLDHAALGVLLPAGGARNALDCALWDLQAKRHGRPVWALLGLERPAPLITTYTVGAGTDAEMAARASAFSDARAVKLKLCGDGADAGRVRAVRAARPDVWLGVDANRSLTTDALLDLVPTLAAAEVRLIEQPFPVGQDARLAGLDLPIPVAADESIQTLADLERLAGLYQAVNIKLDKCGGLTEGLRQAQRAQALGLDVMVGNMLGSSLAMAPAGLVGQFCRYVDLDGPLLLKTDRDPGAVYRGGRILCPDAVWGGGGGPS